MNSGAMQLPWTFPESDHVETVSQRVVDELLQKIELWGKYFAKEGTWVERFRVPSLMACVDFVVQPDGTVGIYEIDERPCGFGISYKLNPLFQARATEMRDKKWPPITVVRSAFRVSDDALFFGRSLSLQEALVAKDVFVLARNRPEEPRFSHLRACSVSTVTQEGDKGYGASMGLWRSVSVTPVGQNAWELEWVPEWPCVLKPLAGVRSHNVKVYCPDRAVVRHQWIRRRGDFESEDRLARLVASQPERRMYRQEFIRPMHFTHHPGSNGMYRMFFGFDIANSAWEPLGGVWMASKSLIIQGSPTTVCGPLMFKE